MSWPPESNAWRRKEGARALIVGNTADFTLMLDPFLRSTGFDVYIAFSASDASRVARGVSFDLVIVDLGALGHEVGGVCEVLRAISGYEETLIIALTGPPPPGKQKVAPHSCYTVSLQKPIDFKALLALIGSRLNMSPNHSLQSDLEK
jgi:DNA-binding response OmpR family regulator